MDKNLQTAKVDVRRLQLLNDRIVQTLDALNQVRMSSTGGFAHSNPWVGGFNQGIGYSQYPQFNQGLGYSNPYGAFNTPMVQNYVDPRMAQINPGFAPQGQFSGFGLSHSNPYATNGFVPQTPVAGLNTFGQNPYYGVAPTTNSFYNNPVEMERARLASVGFGAPINPISIW